MNCSFAKIAAGCIAAGFMAVTGAQNALAQTAEEPIITFKTNIYDTYGAENRFHIVLGSTETDFFDVDCGFGMVEVEVKPAYFNPESQAVVGTPVQCVVSEEGLVKIYGDPSKIDYLDCEGCYIDWIEMPGLSNLQIIDLSHNELKRLDLSPFSNLYAIYLSDNPFTAETPAKVGPNHPELTILELDILDYVDQGLNLSDYPKLQVFDGYHTLDIRKVDVTGCPLLRSITLEMTSVETLDLSNNPELTSLNISESRIRSIDLSHNTKLQLLLCGHGSGSVNTDIHMETLDVTHNPELNYLSAQYNSLTELDLSNNPALAYLQLKGNNLSSIDLSANKNLYLVNIARNNFSFETLPAPEPTWGEYYYGDQQFPVSRSYEVNKPIDFSAKVMRPGSVTTAQPYVIPYGAQPEMIDDKAYTFENGILTFTEVPGDSVYVKFANSVFEEYTIDSGTFMVKSAEDMNQPSGVLSISVNSNRVADTFAFKIGVDSSVSGSDEFYVDVKSGTNTTTHTFTASSTSAPAENNVTLTLPSGDVDLVVKMPENTVLTAFEIDGMPVASLNVTRATELRTLSVTNCGLTDIDLRFNRCLTAIDLSDNNLPSLDLTGIYGNYEKFALRSVKACRNNLTEFTVPYPSTLNFLDLSYNNLPTLLLKDYSGIKYMDLSHNAMEGEIILTYLTEAEYVDLSYNALESALIDTFPNNIALNLGNNQFTFATLPYLHGYSGYVYAPQPKLQILTPAPAINISEQNRDIDGVFTSFEWKNAADGTPLVEGKDFEGTDGAVRFLTAALGKEVYCELTHPAFPQFSGDNAFLTTNTTVIDAPTKVVASFTTTESRNNAEVIFRGHVDTALYIDWRGDGSEYKQYTVPSDTYIDYTDQKTYAGAEVKVYTYNDATDISVFSIYDAPMQNLDASAMTKLISFNIGSCGVDEDNVTFPLSDDMVEIKLPDNNFSKKDFSDYPNLTQLNISNNSYTSFDAGKLPALQFLAIEYNQLTELNLDNPALVGLMAGGNRLSEIDFTNTTRLTDVDLSYNQFQSINLKPLARRLTALSVEGNRFTFATLPRMSEMYALSKYYYTGQADVEVECNGGIVDMSADAKVDGIATQYTWYLGDVTYDIELGEIVGEALDDSGDDPEYKVEGGVTSFFSTFNDDVCCVMTNSLYPNLILYTVPVHVDRSAGVENVAVDAVDANAPVDVYTVAGVMVRSQVARSEATAGLAPGIYLVGGTKVAVR